MIKVSVIIPVYNVEKYLRECLDSVFKQTLHDIEIICVNDGSTDGSLDILNEYKNKYSNLVLISRENRGVSYSRNEAIKIARGEFVCFMDPDDFYPSDDVLEALYNAAVKNDVKIAGGEFAYYNNKTKILSQNFGKTENGYLFNRDGIVKYNDYQFDYGFHRFIYNKEFLINNNLFFPDLIRFEDPVFFVKAMYMAGAFYALNKATYAYRTNHKTFKMDNINFEQALRGIILNMEFAKENRLKGLEAYCNARLKHHYNLYDKVFISPTIFILLFKAMLLNKKVALYFLNKILCNIFSLKNTQHGKIKHKMVTILGFKFKFNRRIVNAEG